VNGHARIRRARMRRFIIYVNVDCETTEDHGVECDGSKVWHDVHRCEDRKYAE